MRIFEEADRNIGRVGMLDEMASLLIPFQDRRQDEEGECCDAIQIFNQCLVGTREIKYVPDTFLGSDIIHLLKDS